jgi:hypothetical protein
LQTGEEAAAGIQAAEETSTGAFWVFYSPEGWDDADAWQALQASPVTIRRRSDWLRGVSVEVSRDWAVCLGFLPGVREIRPVTGLGPIPLPVPVTGLGPGQGGGSFLPPAPSRSPDPVVGDRAREQERDSVYGGLGAALEILGIPRVHGLGFTGSGVRMGILDGTFLEDHSTLRLNPPLATMDFVDGDESVYPDPSDPPGAASHGTALWSLLTGDEEGLFRGAAPGAEVILARVRGLDPLAPADEDRWVAGLEWMVSRGARIVLSGVSFRDFPGFSYSLSDLDGDSTPSARAADRAAALGVLVVAPVGNGGPAQGSLETPADGDSVLSAGAVDDEGLPLPISAVGPTGDGRKKPELFAPGFELPAASAFGDRSLEPMTGTEFAGALLAGSAALVVEAYPGRGPMEILQTLETSVTGSTGPGVGVPDVSSAILFPEGVTPVPLEDVDGTGHLTNLSPLFRWSAPTLHPLALPVIFHVELAEDSLFQGPLRSDSVVGTFARRFPEPLPPRTRMFWRIRAQSAPGVERLTVSQGPFLVPSWVSLAVLNEAGGVEVQDPQPLFRWRALALSPPAGPLTFELQVVSERETEIIQSHPGLEEEKFKIPSPLPFNVPLRWRVIARGRTGGADTVSSLGPFVVTSGANPPATILYQNFPNPFPNQELGIETTRVWFDLAETARVELAVHDLRGRLVRQLIPRRGCPPVELPAGIYGRESGSSGDPCQSFTWDGRDERDREVAEGVYLLRLRAGGFVQTRRMVFWR